LFSHSLESSWFRLRASFRWVFIHLKSLLVTRKPEISSIKNSKIKYATPLKILETTMKSLDA
jgi:hypothetical protein